MLERLNKERFFYYFTEISKIPRGSGNTKAVSDYVVNWAKEQGLYVRQDEWNNVVIRREASEGRETEPGVILQGHLDMVAEKTPESCHDFLKDGLTLMVEGDFLTAKDTTLGADDGIAIAYAMALLEEDYSHPMLEAIFTSDEETGMDGARNIDLSDIKGSYVLNLDSEEDGILTAGCAGGAKVTTTIPIQKTNVTGTKYEIKICGLKGGHSGVEIHKERANADKLMARALANLTETIRYELCNIYGGQKDNAIPRECICELVTTDSQEKLCAFFEDFAKTIQNEYAIADKDICVVVDKKEEGSFEVFVSEDKEKIVNYLNYLPNGVINRSQDIPELVETSLNIGILKTEDSYVLAQSAVRSSVASRKQFLIEQLQGIAKMVGGKAEAASDYPSWAFRSQSKLRDRLVSLYEEMFGETMKVDIIHAGLECGYLLEKKPELDIVSFGPMMYDIHTTEERLSISSAEKMYQFVKCFLSEN